MMNAITVKTKFQEFCAWLNGWSPDNPLDIARQKHAEILEELRDIMAEADKTVVAALHKVNGAATISTTPIPAPMAPQCQHCAVYQNFVQQAQALE